MTGLDTARILCVEDDPGVARLMEKRLAREGYRLDLAADGLSGLSMAMSGDYAVLLVDQRMPGMSGLEMIRRLSEIGRLPVTIMITGAGDERTAVEAMKLGASDYIIKDAAGGFFSLLPAVIEKGLNAWRLAERGRRMETELARAEKLRAIANMAGGIAHDFNNLLTVVLGYIDMTAEDERLDPSLRPMLGTAAAASLQARDLIQKFTLFSSGGHPVMRRGCIRELLADAAHLSVSGAGAACELDLAPDMAEVFADSGNIRQVINNLVMNAVEAMDGGGVVRVSAENRTIRGEADLEVGGVGPPPGRYLRVAIRDTGRGIPGEHLEKVMDPYFSTKQRGAEKGMGFGLSTAYSIIQRHGGHIAIDSAVGVGTTVSIHLPAAEPAEPAQAPPPAPDAADVSFAGRRALVMDDEEMVREVAARMLDKLGIEAACVADGQAAADRYAEAMRAGRPFDAVILDLTVRGGMGGEGAIAAIRAIDPDARAIVTSGYGDNPIMKNHHAYGFMATLAKPYDRKELIDALRRLFQ